MVQCIRPRWREPWWRPPPAGTERLAVIDRPSQKKTLSHFLSICRAESQAPDSKSLGFPLLYHSLVLSSSAIHSLVFKAGGISDPLFLQGVFSCTTPQSSDYNTSDRSIVQNKPQLDVCFISVGFYQSIFSKYLPAMRISSRYCWNTTAYSPICLGGHGWLHLRADFHWSKLPVWLGSHEIGKYEGIKSESFQFIFYILSLAIERGIAPICLKLIFFSLKYQRSEDRPIELFLLFLYSFQ